MSELEEEYIYDPEEDEEGKAKAKKLTAEEEYKLKFREMVREVLPADKSVLPVNEQTVIVDDADFSGLKTDGKLKLELKDGEGLLLYGGKVKARLKKAFAAKLAAERKGQFATITVFSEDPPMVRLEYSDLSGKDKSAI